MHPIPTDAAWLAPLAGSTARAASLYADDPLKAVWLPNEAFADAWMQYVADTAVADDSPPPVPTNVRVIGHELRWDAEADLECGLACFIIMRDGAFLNDSDFGPACPLICETVVATERRPI